MTVAVIQAPTTPDPLTFSFVRWTGPPPALVRQHVETFTTPGVSSSGARWVGAYGDSFTVRADGVFAIWGSTDRTLVTAELAAYRARELVGQVCLLSYEGIDYQALYQHRYLVENLVVEGIKRHARLLGPTYNFPLGALLSLTWTLRPVYVGTGDPVPPPGSGS